LFGPLFFVGLPWPPLLFSFGSCLFVSFFFSYGFIRSSLAVLASAASVSLFAPRCLGLPLAFVRLLVAASSRRLALLACVAVFGFGRLASLAALARCSLCSSLALASLSSSGSAAKAALGRPLAASHLHPPHTRHHHHHAALDALGALQTLSKRVIKQSLTTLKDFLQVRFFRPQKNATETRVLYARMYTHAVLYTLHCTDVSFYQFFIT
jgi:hypothetical protein